LPLAANHPLFYVGIFSLISVFQAFIETVAKVNTYIGSTKASRKLFKQLLESVISATFRWYDITPVGTLVLLSKFPSLSLIHLATGRIVHRFSNVSLFCIISSFQQWIEKKIQDIKTIDSTLAGTVQGLNSSTASFATSVVTIIIFFPQFLVPAIVMAFIYHHLIYGYLNTSRDLRRMECML
jgi:ABC-type multidrug transport system fused ATPase/permease subunit